MYMTVITFALLTVSVRVFTLTSVDLAVKRLTQQLNRLRHCVADSANN